MPRVTQSDIDEFEEIVAEHRGPVYGYLRARVVQAADAENLTQEVFLRFYLSRSRFDGDGMLRAWLIGIARNLLREHARGLRKRKEVAWTELCLEIEDASAEPSDDNHVAELPACLDGLGPSAREAIELKYRANWKLAQIGERLRRSEGAVKLLVFRARQALRYCLERRQPPDPPD